MYHLSRSSRRMINLVTLILLGFQSMLPAMASVGDGDFMFRTPVSEAVLDSMRGGFQRDLDGPFMSFGIERHVFDNDKLVSTTVLRIPDMTRLADLPGMRSVATLRDMKPGANLRDMNTVVDQLDMKPFADRSGTSSAVDSSHVKPFAGHTAVRPVADPPSELFTFTQSGPGNSLPPDLSSLPPFTTVIQNSLDNRTIQSETVINATVEALTWARSLELGNALSLATVEAIRH